jgi:hypothetical protein
MSKPRIAKASPAKQAGDRVPNAELLAGLVRSLVALSRRVPKGPLREKADEAWRAAKILEIRGESGAELAALDEILVKQRDVERIYRNEENRPKPWDGAALFMAAEVIGSVLDYPNAKGLSGNLDFLLSPDEIAHELRGLAELCCAIATSDTADAGEACWALEQALRRLAARAERLKSPDLGHAGAEDYAVVPKPKAVAS